MVLDPNLLLPPAERDCTVVLCLPVATGTGDAAGGAAEQQPAPAHVGEEERSSKRQKVEGEERTVHLPACTAVLRMFSEKWR